MRLLPWAFGGLVVFLGMSACNVFAPDLNPSRAPQPTTAQPPSSAANRDTGPAFPGKQARDFAAYPGEGVTFSGGVWVSTTPIRQTRRSGDRYICTDVTLKNGSAEAARFSYTDWKLQVPTGVITEATWTGSDRDLQSGELASGGTTSGDVCFDAPKSGLTDGVYVVLLEPEFFSSERIAWINQLSPPSAPTTPTSTSTTAPSAPPPSNGFPATITGTCDLQGQCSGVQQRTEPRNSAPQLLPVILREGSSVTVFCQTIGELRTETDHAPSNLWYRLANGAYVNSIYITPPDGRVPECQA